MNLTQDWWMVDLWGAIDGDLLRSRTIRIVDSGSIVYMTEIMRKYQWIYLPSSKLTIQTKFEWSLPIRLDAPFEIFERHRYI